MEKGSTRRMLLSLLEDIEIVSKELLEYTDSQHHNSSLITLLTNKDAAFQHHIAIAKEQEIMQTEVEELEMEIEKRDVNIRQLQVNLKTAEEILSTIVYEASQKLKSIEQASKRKVSSEELIKYAHKISASNCVNSPPNWMPGDARRPFPTEAEMRAGLLFTSEQQHNNNNNNIDRQLSGTFQYGGPGSLSWQPSVEVQSTLLNRVDKVQQQQPSQQQLSQQQPLQQQQLPQPPQHLPPSQLKQLLRPNQQQQLIPNNNINIQQNPQQQQVNKEEVDLMSSDSSSSSSSDE